MRKIFTILMTILAVTAYCQTLKTFNGAFNDGKTQNGTAVYTFYEDPTTHDYLKQGAFKYTFNGKSNYQGYVQTINGNFEKGLKHGTWSYTITMNDFGSDNPYYTGTVSLVSNYKNGYADGNWKEVRSYKTRKKYYQNGQYKWEEFGPMKTMTINMNFKNGYLIGAVSINDEFANFKTTGNYDNNSFCIGTWIINDMAWGKNKELIYKDNTLYEFIARGNSGALEEGSAKYQKDYDNYIKAKTMTAIERQNAGLTIDTLCGDEKCSATNNIKEYFPKLFSVDYFLYEYIGGDLSFKEGFKGGCEINSTKCAELSGNNYYGGFLKEADNSIKNEEYSNALSKLNNIPLIGFCKSDIQLVEAKINLCKQKIQEIEKSKNGQTDFYKNFEKSEYDSLAKLSTYFWEHYTPRVNQYPSTGFAYPTCHPKNNSYKSQTCNYCIIDEEGGTRSLNNEDERDIALSQLKYFKAISNVLMYAKRPSKDEFLANINPSKIDYEKNKTLFTNKIILQNCNIKLNELNKQSKKKVLFKKYIQLYSEMYAYVVEKNNSLNDRTTKSTELVLISNKTITLFNQDTTELEAQLKNAETVEQIKTILLGQ